MNRGFYTIMGAQFLSSLADNALLIAAIALLSSIGAPDWMTPLLKLFFVVSYVLLAAWVGIFSDSMPKGRVMFLTNFLKAVGCLLMLFGSHPLLAYAVVGVGAAAYSPAKYGILTELLPPEKLVVANGWIEGLTVGSIILGVVLGGVLVRPDVAACVIDFCRLEAVGLATVAESAIFVTTFVYLAAALVNLAIPDTGARYPKQDFRPVASLKHFAQSCMLLWHDKLGQISLSVTSLFWGTGAVLQFLVLKWCEHALGMGRGEHRDCARRLPRGGKGAPQALALGSAPRDRDGRARLCALELHARHGPCGRHRLLWARALLGRHFVGCRNDRDRHLRGLFRGAHERAPSAQGARAHERRAVDRCPELQRELLDPPDARALLASHPARPLGADHDDALWRLRDALDGARHLEAPGKPGRRRQHAPDRRGKAPLKRALTLPRIVGTWSLCGVFSYQYRFEI